MSLPELKKTHHSKTTPTQRQTNQQRHSFVLYVDPPPQLTTLCRLAWISPPPLLPSQGQGEGGRGGGPGVWVPKMA